MKKVSNILKEIESSLKGIDIFLIMIKTMVIFTVFYLLLFVINVQPFYAFVPSVIYFLSSLFVEPRQDYVRMVESKYDELNEKLRTARDYKDKDNIVLEDLEHDIVRELKKVHLSKFFSYSKAAVLVFLLMLAVSSSLYIASHDIRVIDVDDIFDEVRKRFERMEDEENEVADFISTEESIMEVGNEKIQVEINPVGIDFDFNDVSEEADYEFSTAFPREIFISAGSAYEKEFTEEQQALIKRYFDKKTGS